MIRLASLLIATSVLLPAAPVENDREAVHRAVADYVEGIYLVQPELIERSVSPDLVKRGAWRPDDSTEYHAFGVMTFDQLHKLAGSWNKEGRQGEDLTFEIEVHDVMDITASAKPSAKWGIDYMQLMKVDGKWTIIHILWQSYPPEAAAD